MIKGKKTIVDSSAGVRTSPLLCAVRSYEEGFVYSTSDEICPFCEKEKVISGAWLHFRSTGHPCCEKCYQKGDGFDKWFEEAEKLWTKYPKQLDWFIEMYCRGYTPDEAVDTMMSVV
jgi:hypothetical protein